MNLTDKFQDSENRSVRGTARAEPMPELPIALMSIAAALETQPGLEHWDRAIQACDQGMLQVWERRFWAERALFPERVRAQIEKECWLLELIRTNLRLANRAAALAATHQALKALKSEPTEGTLAEDTGAWSIDAQPFLAPPPR